MIEEILIKYLNDNLDVEAYCERPKDLPDTYILLENSGTSEENCIKSSMMIIQSIAPTLLEAMKLNEKVVDLMKDAHELPELFSSHLNSYYNYTDTSTKEYRYQCVFDITY